MAELHRQQAAMANEMARQTMEFWSRAWMVPAKGKERRRR